MSGSQKKYLSDLAIRVAFWFPFRKRFTREEYSELSRILRAETKDLIRRPTYVLGLIVSGGLSLYFVINGLSGAGTDWRTVGLGLLIMFGYTCGINSTREHLCERLLRLKHNPERTEEI